MNTFSKTQVYKNGNKVSLEPSDHVSVREILSKGAVKRVDNFGPFLNTKEVKADEVLTVGNYELHIVNIKESFGFALGVGLTTAKDVNLVYYQRIK